MKRGNRLTRTQKEVLSRYSDLNVEEWFFVSETPDEITVSHKETKETKTIQKLKKKRK